MTQWQRVGRRPVKFAVCPHLLCAVPHPWQALNGSAALAKQTHVETRLSRNVCRKKEGQVRCLESPRTCMVQPKGRRVPVALKAGTDSDTSGFQALTQLDSRLQRCAPQV